jgi:hypothetical protein
MESTGDGNNELMMPICRYEPANGFFYFRLPKSSSKSVGASVCLMNSVAVRRTVQKAIFTMIMKSFCGMIENRRLLRLEEAATLRW